eukprot:1493244-Pleurochrysis_carterae.AAC.1
MAGGGKRVLQCRCRATSCAGSQECVTMPLRRSGSAVYTARPVARLAALHLGRRSLAAQDHPREQAHSPRRVAHATRRRLPRWRRMSLRRGS